MDPAKRKTVRNGLFEVLTFIGIVGTVACFAGALNNDNGGTRGFLIGLCVIFGIITCWATVRRILGG